MQDLEKAMPDDDGAMLRGYQARVPADLQEELRRRLTAEMPTRRRWLWPTVAAAGVAAALAGGAWLVISRYPHNPRGVREMASTVPSKPGPRDARLGDATAALGRAFGLDANPAGGLGLAYRLGLTPEEPSASLIVRARIVGWEGTTVDYAVERVIYGEWAEKTIKLDMTYGDASVKKSFMDEARRKYTDEKRRAPSEDELLGYLMNDHGIQKGREVILLLEPRNGALLQHGEDFDAPPERSLDKDEERIANMVHDGNYLEIVPEQGLGDVFQMNLNAADAVVRAKLAEITEDGVTWKVEKVLRGKGITETLQIDNDLYRKRAEAWVNYEALKDGSLKDADRHAAEVKKEMAAMIKAELAPGREAILFLGNLRHDANTTQADLRGRVYDTSKRVSLDDLEAAIARPQNIEIHL